MENSENSTLEVKRSSEKPQQIGSKSFLVVITAMISIFATLMCIYIANDGIVFVKSTQYGDLTAVLPVCEVIDNVEKEYYSHDGEVPNSEQLVRTSIDAIIDSLDDPYSRYFTAEEFAEYSKSTTGNFNGLGIVIDTPDEKGSLIKTVYEDSPAEEAGLKSGDIITSVNGTSTCGVSLDTVSELLTGEIGDKMHITVDREGQSVEIAATIGEVRVKSVKSKMLDGKVGYIYINQFMKNTSTEFTAAIDALKKDGMKSLIIDVRNNPGGFLDAVIGVADTILDSGTIVSIGNTLSDPDLEVLKAKSGGIDCDIVVLINENSASASEILAAAIKENDAGELVGVTTFGKGIVQTTGQLYSSDSYLKLTTDAYYTPDSNDIHGKGVSPDVIIDLPDELKGYDVTTLPLEKDVQLLKAIDMLSR